MDNKDKQKFNEIKNRKFNYLNNKNKELTNIIVDLFKINNQIHEENNRIIRENELLQRQIIELNTNQKNQINTLENQFKEYKKFNDTIIDSYNKQFTTLFLYTDLKTRSFLKYNQLLNKELLDFVVNVCDKYGLKNYWLDYGNLLGAVRHDGFIPWDDDVDMGFMRKDYNKFVEVIPKEIEKNNLSNLMEISLNMKITAKTVPCLQLFYNGGINAILAGIDLFPYDFIGDLSNCNVESFKEVRFSVHEKNRAGVPIDIALEEYFDKFDITLDMNNHILLAPDGGSLNIPFMLFETSKIFPLKKITFENTEYNCPNDIQYYLTKLYGDYLEIPKNIYYHHHRFNILRKKEDGIEFYKNCVSTLHEVNESYKL